MAAVGWKNLQYLKGLAMVMVVLNHAVRQAGGYYLHGQTSLDPASDPLSVSVFVFFNTITTFCVPAFIFSSGFMIFRMVRNWRGAAEIAWKVARIYLFWSIPLTVFFSILNWPISFSETALNFVESGPFPGYWFLPLMVQLYLIAPICIAIVKKSPWLTLGVIALFQVFVWTSVYFTGLREALPSFVINPHRFYFHIPMFLAGMLASANVKVVLAFLERHRRLLLGACLITLAGRLGETVWCISEAQWSISRMNDAFSGERITATLFAISMISFVISRDSVKSKLATWLGKVGNSATGILLMMDAWLWFVYAVAWQLPVRSPWGAELLAQGDAPAQWLLNLGMLLLPVLWVFGMWGPMTIMKLIERRFKKKVTKHLW